MVKLLIGVSTECNKALREACKQNAIELGKTKPTPMGPFVESILARSAPIKRAAKAVGVTLPKRPADARGKYSRG